MGAGLARRRERAAASSRPATLHVTLVFCGRVPAERVEEVRPDDPRRHCAGGTRAHRLQRASRVRDAVAALGSRARAGLLPNRIEPAPAGWPLGTLALELVERRARGARSTNGNWLRARSPSRRGRRADSGGRRRWRAEPPKRELLAPASAHRRAANRSHVPGGVRNDASGRASRLVTQVRLCA